MSTDKGTEVSIKTEPGSTFKRLPSFKTPRDLNLTDGRTKKVFVPNLNVQRRKPNEDARSVSGAATVPETKQTRDRPGRGRGRGGANKNFVQTGGVFSEGLGPSTRPSRKSASSYSSGGGGGGGSGGGGGGGGGGGSSSVGLARSRTAVDRPVFLMDKEEEELVMRELLRDDFLDDPHLLPDEDQPPIGLPQLKIADFKFKTKEDEPVLKEKVQSQQMNGIKVKEERMESTLSISSPPPDVAPSSEEKPTDLAAQRQLSLSSVLAEAGRTHEYIFFQVPNSLPNSSVLRTSQPSKNDKPKPSKHDSSEETVERCTLRSLPSGAVGKVQFLKSGRARLVLGNVRHWIEPSGAQTTFQQELISADLNPSDHTGHLIHQGHLTTKMILTPDWEALLT